MLSCDGEIKLIVR